MNYCTYIIQVKVLIKRFIFLALIDIMQSFGLLINAASDWPCTFLQQFLCMALAIDTIDWWGLSNKVCCKLLPKQGNAVLAIQFTVKAIN